MLTAGIKWLPFGSQAYGMMGWRVGYIAYPSTNGQEGELGMQLLKVQDTIPICPPQLS